VEQLKLTKSERHNTYKAALKRLKFEQKKKYLPWVCVYLCDIHGYDIDIKKEFPEFAKHEPKKHGTGWFPPDDYKTRIEILNQCINETM